MQLAENVLTLCEEKLQLGSVFFFKFVVLCALLFRCDFNEWVKYY